MKREYLECGKIISAHGVKGLVKLESWCDSAKILASRKRVYFEKNGVYTEYPVISASPAGENVIMNIGLPSREAAQGLKNTVIYLKRCDIPVPAGAALIADMIDLPVIDYNSGKVYGVLSDVTDAPQGKIYTVKYDGKEALIPDRPEFIKKIDTDTGIYITPIPGFFD